MLKAVPPSTTAAPPRPKPEDMLEELLDLVRGLERSASAHREELLEIVHRASASPLSAANPAGWFGCTVGWPPASSIPMGSPSVLFAGPITPVPPPDKPQGRST